MSQGTSEGESATLNGGDCVTFVHLCVVGAKRASQDIRLLVSSSVAEF